MCAPIAVFGKQLSCKGIAFSPIRLFFKIIFFPPPREYKLQLFWFWYYGSRIVGSVKLWILNLDKKLSKSWSILSMNSLWVLSKLNCMLVWLASLLSAEKWGLSHYAPHEIIEPLYVKISMILEAIGYLTTKLGGGGNLRFCASYGDNPCVIEVMVTRLSLKSLRTSGVIENRETVRDIKSEFPSDFSSRVT